MRTIYKFTLRPGMNELELEPLATPRHVAAQGNNLVLWAELDTRVVPVKRLFRVYATGESIDKALDARHQFIGSIVMYDMDWKMVWHVYEVVWK